MEPQNQELRRQLAALSDEKYRRFSASLLPNVDNILGVRLPVLRKIAKATAKGDWQAYLAFASDSTFEETMLQGLVIGYVNACPEELLRQIARFVPKINNWSVCDSFCIGLKFTLANRDAVWEFLQPYFSSSAEFDVRFAVVMLLNFYMEPEWIDRTLARLNLVRHTGYYAQMAVAWAVSMYYVKFPEQTMPFLLQNSLDDFTFHKALQKITESLCVDKEQKNTSEA